jgi:hypothetical protein
MNYRARTPEEWEQRFGKEFWNVSLTSLMGNDLTEEEARILAVEMALDPQVDDDGYDPYEDWMEAEMDAMRGEL